MPEYGVTEQGFVLKRMDTILAEIHADLTEGFGFDTSLEESSFLNVLVTTFAGQIADLWEQAQDSYYAKYPATADHLNLDHAVQYGGIRREAARQTCFPLHCTGDDGTVVTEGAVVATDTKPEIRLYAAQEFTITRQSCNAISVRVAAPEKGAVYSMTVNGEQYSYSSTSADEAEILEGMKKVFAHAEYRTEIDPEEPLLVIEDTVKARSNEITLSDNLTTGSVTTIANFYTEEYGNIAIPSRLVSRMITNRAGFTGVENLLPPAAGRLAETDVELRQSYLAKSALRSNTMIDSVVAELLNNVADVETATGYENDTDAVDENGLLPHSIEIIVEGGDNSAIAEAILRRKAGGIQTNGKISVNVAGLYGDAIPVRFNRPEYLYAYLKITLHGDPGAAPSNYAGLAVEAVMEDTKGMKAGESLLVQHLHDGIYSHVAGITYIDIAAAYSADVSYVPEGQDYKAGNIMVNARQKVLLSDTRIEVVFVNDDS